jgi:hypothetical protein
MLTSDDRRTYDVEEAGRLLGLGRNASYEAVKRGDFGLKDFERAMDTLFDTSEIHNQEIGSISDRAPGGGVRARGRS